LTSTARAPSRADRPARFFHALDAAHGRAAQRLGLGDVGRDEGRNGQKPLPHDGGGGVIQQPRAVLGDHDGVHHHRARAGDRLGDARRDIRGEEHPGLDGVGADILEDRGDLRGDELRRHGMHAAHAQGVLRRQRRDRGGSPGAEGAHGLEVGLDAGAAARVRSRHDQNAFHASPLPRPAAHSLTISPRASPS